jgi:hypothetical protein
MSFIRPNCSISAHALVLILALALASALGLALALAFVFHLPSECMIQAAVRLKGTKAGEHVCCRVHDSSFIN